MKPRYVAVLGDSKEGFSLGGWTLIVHPNSPLSPPRIEIRSRTFFGEHYSARNSEVEISCVGFHKAFDGGIRLYRSQAHETAYHNEFWKFTNGTFETAQIWKHKVEQTTRLFCESRTRQDERGEGKVLRLGDDPLFRINHTKSERGKKIGNEQKLDVIEGDRVVFECRFPSHENM